MTAYITIIIVLLILLLIAVISKKSKSSETETEQRIPEKYQYGTAEIYTNDLKLLIVLTDVLLDTSFSGFTGIVTDTYEGEAIDEGRPRVVFVKDKNNRFVHYGLTHGLVHLNVGDTYRLTLSCDKLIPIIQ